LLLENVNLYFKFNFKFLLSVLLTNFFVNGTEYKQKYNYSLTQENFKKLPEVLISKIIEYHPSFNKLLSFYRFRLILATFATVIVDEDKNYILARYYDDKGADLLYLSSFTQIPLSDPIIPEIKAKLRTMWENQEEHYPKENRKFICSGTQFGSSGERSKKVLYLSLTKKYFLSFIRKMNLQQIKLLMDFQRTKYFKKENLLYKNSSRKPCLNRDSHPTQLSLDYDQTKTFHSLPEYFIKCLKSLDFEFEFEI